GPLQEGRVQRVDLLELFQGPAPVGVVDQVVQVLGGGDGGRQAALPVLVVEEVGQGAGGDLGIGQPAALHHVAGRGVGDVPPEVVGVGPLADAGVGQVPPPHVDPVEPEAVPAVPVVPLQVRVVAGEGR